MEQFWMGSGSSLQAYSDLKQVYLGSTTVAPLAFSQSFADTFKTTKERIGLMLLDRSGSTGIIYAHGSLVNNHEWWHTYEVGNVTSYAAIRDAVNILIEDDTIERIVLNVESPGGSVAGINAASDVIKSAKRKKPIQAHTDNMATSAGYWLASATDLVTAGKMASVGSIGVIAIYEEFTKAAEKYGIQFHVFTAGKEKGYGFGGTEFTDEEKEAIQSRIDKMYNFFLSHVASARNVSLRDKETWADAKIFFAGEAKAVGLVDSITSLEDVIGGKAAVSKNSNKKSAKAMTISEEKLARIAAGESPETVLTPAELAMHLEGQIEGEGDNEPEAPEAPENPTEPEVEPEVPEAPSATATADLTKMAISLGRAEAKVESLEAQLTALREELEASKAGVSALTVVAQAAVTNLQIALREPKEKATAPAAILAQYEELQGKFQSKFSVGRKSSAKADTAEMDMTPRIPNPNRPL